MRLAEDPNYTRLPGSSRTFFGLVQYWLAKDHVLLVEVIWVTERYRRFELKDMIALTVRPTRLRLWLSLVLIPIVPICLGLALYLNRAQPIELSQGVAVALAVLGLIALSALLWVAARGEGCEVRLTTSVQSLVLPGLKFRRGMERFREALVNALPRAEPRPPGAFER